MSGLWLWLVGGGQLDAKEGDDMSTLTKRLAEVRKRVIVDFYSGTAPSSTHWVACRLCDWIWRWGEAELHAEDCPVRVDSQEVKP